MGKTVGGASLGGVAGEDVTLMLRVVLAFGGVDVTDWGVWIS